MPERTFKAGSIVKMATDHLFENKTDYLSMMGHHIRPYIYGVIPFNRAAPGPYYYVYWAIEGMFNMNEDEEWEIKDEYTFSGYLNLVKDKDDANEGDDNHIQTFFRHTGEGWILRDPILSCDNCEGEEGNQIVGTRGCMRTRRKYQIPMMQLYFDLELQINSHMTNAQKRFTCYRFYTKVVHGVLISGDRRRVCACVDEEIGRRFPREEGVNRVGFRE